MTRVVNIKRMLIFIAVILVITATGIVLNTGKVYAVSPWHEVYLTPGQTYDVSKAKWNTTVYINKAGSYTLKGDSTKCRVVIQSGGVNVYLADGLKIDPGIKAYVGSRTAAITVNDMNGTVKLISKPGANVYFGGYLTAPAIRKYGYNSKLVFETEHPANPGTITAYRSHSSSSAGIGSAYEFSGRVNTGNIEINSGNIIATGGMMSAGIGGGGNGNAYYITINGGNVRAVGGDNGTGIGGGYHGNAYDIKINGGTIYAEGTFGAGIGSGEQSAYAKNIVINDGKIDAKSSRGAAIGGGQRSEVENLRINGGTINAVGENGIGGAAYQHYGNVKSLYITGGIIYAEGFYVGIGASVNAPGPNNIYISGGDITTKGGSYALGGGGMSGVTDSKRVTNVTVSGGTIKADGGDLDIGGTVWLDEMNITIIGGSLYADELFSSAKDQFGNTVKRTDVKLDSVKGNVDVIDADITKLNNSYPDYGMNDVVAKNGMLYLWISEDTEVKAASTGPYYTYVGTVKSGQSGVLYLKTTCMVNYDTNVPSNTNSEVVVSGSLSQEVEKGDALTPPDVKLKGYKFGGWYSSADCSGEALTTVKHDMTLYAKWIPQTYTVTFKAGPEDDAAVKTQEMIYDVPEVLEVNTFAAPEGMRFAGWMRYGVLGGTLRADQSVAVNLCDISDEINEAHGYTLMAVWVTNENPTVTMTLNGKPFTGNNVKLVLDNDHSIEVVLESMSGMQGIYSYNPGSESMQNGKYSIYVNGTDTGINMVIGEGDNFVSLEYYSVVLGCDENLDKKSIEGSSKAVLKGTEVEISIAGEGENAEFVFDKWHSIECEPDYIGGTDAGSASAIIKVDEKITLLAVSKEAAAMYTVYFNGNGNDSGSVEEINFTEGESINAPECGYGKEDYHFTGWNTGIDGTGEKTYFPGTEMNDLNFGTNNCATLYAIWEHDYYTVKYDANGGEGTVPEIQVSTEGKYMLSNPGFAREEYVLEGWNTDSDGKGTYYDLDQEVTDLIEKGEYVVLYAQWKYEPTEESGGEDGNAGGSDDTDNNRIDNTVDIDSDNDSQTPENIETDNSTVATGDDSNLTTVIVVMLVALVTMIGAFAARRMKKH